MKIHLSFQTVLQSQNKLFDMESLKENEHEKVILLTVYFELEFILNFKSTEWGNDNKFNKKKTSNMD